MTRPRTPDNSIRFTAISHSRIVRIVPLDTVAVIVMAKFPEPGKVKTRLLPMLSADQAASVQRAFVQHVMSRLAAMGPPELVMCFDPPESGRAMFQLVGTHATRHVAQAGGDLGARIDAAAREFSKWYGRMLFLGVDSPDVPTAHLDRAAELLKDNEVVLGPCSDGGFWCFGMQDHISPRLLFEQVQWSSGSERQQTIDRAAALDCSCVLADAWDDVDRPEDLTKLVARLGESQDPLDKRLLETLGFVPQGVAS